MANNILISPILKWVGGKRRLLADIMPLINKSCSTYVEPFVGGGAVFFELQPKKAIINDYNIELINVYEVIRDFPEELIVILEEHNRENTEEYFYNLRALDRSEEYAKLSNIQRAARIIYLNKTCYNGLYRVNSAGQFNSPYGKYKNPNIVNATTIRAMSKYLRNPKITIKQGDYKEALKGLRKGAFVYLDPPYMPISSSSSFTGYTENGFSYEQQIALKNECDKLKEKGISFLQSNSDCPEIRELYKEYDIRTVQAKRSINSNANKRGEISEVLIYYVPEKNNLSANEAWKVLIDKYNILEEVQENGCYHIKASQIKQFKEPRLMAKWDSTDALPKVLRDNKINILPDSRSSYVIGDFLLYQEIPILEENVTQMAHVELPDYESIDVNNISSEANAINVLLLTGILDDFLNTNNNVATFNGRMGTGEFEFVVDTTRNIKQKISVNNAQCEIDGGFENNDSVVIMEAKNVVHEDFHIRQLYYPYRLWKNKVNKPIRLVFSVYSNMIYRLFEYRFNILEDYSSIELVRTKNYSLQDTTITLDDLFRVRKDTLVKTDDNMDNSDVPFIQANSMERIISLLENMYENPMTSQQIAELMDFEPRQSDYYYNAGKYLGLFEKVNEDKQRVVALTSLGNKVFKLNYKERQLKIVELILEHQIFSDLFDGMIKTGDMPNKKDIEDEMRALHVCDEGQIVRRASSIYGWLKWIFNLTKL